MKLFVQRMDAGRTGSLCSSPVVWVQGSLHSGKGPVQQWSCPCHPLVSWLQQEGHKCACVEFWVFYGLWVFFEVFLYTCVFEITLKPNTYLCVLLNFCPVLWVMSEAPGVSLALQWIVIIQTILSKKLCYFSPSNVYTPILLPWISVVKLPLMICVNGRPMRTINFKAFCNHYFKR